MLHPGRLEGPLIAVRLIIFRGAALGLVLVLMAATPRAEAETLLERGDYLVDHLMSCGNCHSSHGPGAASRALSGWVRTITPID